MTSTGEPVFNSSTSPQLTNVRSRHCPSRSSHRCSCDPTSIDENFYRLVPLESPQKKPDDTCIRQFLGGNWLDKKGGWSQEIERASGGDGYQGYDTGGWE